MHRIDTPTAQTDKFGAGKNGFTRGNPQTGVPATALDDDYFDTIQEEIARVIESTGVVLNKNNRAQLLAAINTIIANGGDGFLKKANNLSDLGDVQTALKNLTLAGIGIGLPNMVDIANFDWQNFVFTAGANYVTSYNTWVNPPAGITYNAGTRVSIRVIYISTTNGPRMGLELTPDTGSSTNFKVYNLLCVGAAGSRVFTFNQDWNSANPIPATGLDVATNAEVAAGTANKVVTVPGLISLFSKRSFSVNDYIRIPDVPGGLIIQWVQGGAVPSLAAATSAVKAVTFPIPFPTAGLSYWGAISGASTADVGITVTCSGLTATGMSMSIYNTATSAKNVSNVLGIAIGY